MGCLFAAIGGFCKAFEQVGAKVLWANEKDRFARTTFVAIFPQKRHWQHEGDLASVRDPAALDQLPEDEGREWRRLWDDVAALPREVEKTR